MTFENEVEIDISELKILSYELCKHFIPKPKDFEIDMVDYFIGRNSIRIGKTIRCGKETVPIIIEQLKDMISSKEEELHELKSLLNFISMKEKDL